MANLDELKALRVHLKSGEYDGVDIMHAWIAIDELIELKIKKGGKGFKVNDLGEVHWVKADNPIDLFKGDWDQGIIDNG